MNKKLLSILLMVLILTSLFSPILSHAASSDAVNEGDAGVMLAAENAVKITEQPKNVAVANGETAKVIVSASGEGLTYKWYIKNKGDSEFSYSSTFSGNYYHVEMNSSRSGRQIYCVVSDKYGNTATTNIVTMLLTKPLKITKQPQSVTAPKGKTAAVKVSATGEGLTYKWYYRNAGESKFTKTNSVTGDTYSVDMSASRNGRQLYCVVTDKHGNSVTTDTVKLTMGNPLKITKQPKSVTVPKDKTAEIKLSATGDGLKYEWYYKNAGATKFTKTSSVTGNTYSVNMNSSRDGRQVYCIVKDKYGNSITTDTAKFSMGNPLVLKQQPKSVNVKSGKTAKVTVAATGDGLKYEWYYKNSGESKFSYTSSFKGASYSVAMTTARDGRQVYCVISDKHGNSVTSKKVTLSMIKTAKITKQPQSIAAPKGKTAKVTFTATGDGLTYKWYYKNAGASKFSYTSTFKGNTYTAEMNSTRNGRQVYCVITDKYGNTAKTNTVKLNMGNPLKITQQPKSVSVAESVTAKVTIGASGDGLKYSWYYRNEGADKFSKTTSFKSNSYSVVMNSERSGRQVYWVITDKYGNSVKTDTVKLSMAKYSLKITKQPTDASAANGKIATVSFTASGDGLTYKWYYKNAGSSKFSYTSTFKGNTYTAEMDSTRDGRQIYCVVTDEYGNSVRTNTVTISIAHDMGEWEVYYEATPHAEGIERRSCSKCSYYEDRAIAKVKAVYYITADMGDGTIEKIGVGANGFYDLAVPERTGYAFMGWKDADDADFAASGYITGNTSIKAVWEIDATDTLDKLIKLAEEGADHILITGDITVNKPIYITHDVTIYSDGDYTIKRAANYSGDMFVVGVDKNGKTATAMLREAILTLGGGEGMLTIDGNKDALSVTVSGSAVFSCCNATVNVYDGVRITNHKKLGNERALDPPTLVSANSLYRIGGAAIANIEATVNIYGGIIDNNSVATEYSVSETGSNIETNGCGGAIYTLGTLNMYGGTIANNEALRGGGIYNAKVIHMYAGTISGNISHSYGGAISSSSSSTAEMYIGSTSGEGKMVFSGNSSVKTGGALYSATSSPIIIYGNTEFANNTTESSGGAIYTQGTLTVRGATFSGNTSKGSGGGIYHSYTKAEANRRLLEITNCTFKNNTGSLGGALILSASDAVAGTGTYADVTNTSFIGNKAKSDGGAVYVTRYSEADMNGCTFSDNSASGNGGAISMQSNAEVVLKNSDFSGNSASNGGAVHASKNATAKLTNIDVNDNSAVKGNGGGIYITDAKLTFSDVDFNGNSASNHGGGLCLNGVDMKLNDTCEFVGNTAGNHGGGVYVVYKTVDGNKVGVTFTATGTAFKNNTALAGGAVSGRTNCVLNLKDVVMTGNGATGTADDAEGGGAVYTGYGTLNLDNAIITGNTSAGYGGAVGIVSSKVTVAGGKINDNTAATAGGGLNAISSSTITLNSATLNGNSAIDTAYDANKGGGAVNITGGSLIATGVTMDGNSAGFYGGAVHARKATVSFSDDSVISNSVTRTGSAFCLRSSCKATIKNVTLTNNTATGNGTVYNGGCALEFTDITATGNSADKGGIVYVSGNTPLNIKDCTLTGNNANDGGVVYSVSATVNVSNCKLTDNTAKNGGVTYTESGNVTYASDNAISGNFASNGGVVYADEKANVTLNNFEIKNNSAYIGGVIYTKGNVDIRGMKFTENSAPTTAGGSSGNGGAICVAGTTLTVDDTVAFTGNTAGGHGGAIYVVYRDVTDEATSTTTRIPGILEVTGSSFTNNSAVAGGAVSVRSACEATFDGTVFTGNSAVNAAEAELDGDADGGGAIYNGFGMLDLKNTTFTNNTSAGFGGAIQLYSGDVTSEGSTFSGNTAKMGGAVCALNGASDLVFTGTKFISNTATAGYDTSKGGGAIAVKKGNLTLAGVTMDKNSGTFYGGTVWTSGATVAINGNSVISNSKDRTGGTLYFRDSSKVTMEDVTLSGNTATGGGGKGNGNIYASGGTLDMTNVTATGNYGDNGGVLYASGGAKVTLKDSTWSGNTAIMGGAIYNASATITVTNSTIKDGSAELGGAVYGGGGITKIAGVTLTDNAAVANSKGENGFGGAVCMISGDAEITALTKIENNSAVKGGAIYAASTEEAEGATETIVDCTVDITDCTITKNTAKNGGAIGINGAVVNVTGCTITENTVTNAGGAIHVEDAGAELTMADCTVGSHSASSGGVIYAGSDTKVKLSGFELNNNTAILGGAVYTKGDVTLDGMTFIGNKATFNASGSNGNGGAICIVGGKVTGLNTNTFTDNSADGHAGAIYVSYANAQGETGETIKKPGILEMTGGSFTGNTAIGGGAVSIRTDCEATFDGTTFTGNSVEGSNDDNVANGDADGGGAIYVGFGILNLKDAVFTNNTSEAFGGAVQVFNADVNATGGEFSGNTAGTTGGAICALGSASEMILNGTEFTNNTTTATDNTTAYGGGAINIKSGTLKATGVIMDGNTAGYYGGAVHGRGATVTIDGNSVFKNSNGTTGSALYFRDKSTATIEDAEITGNKATGIGVVYLTNGTLNITNADVHDNTGSNGVVYVSGTSSKATIKDSGFTKNTGNSGGAIHLREGVMTVTGCEFKENTASNGGALYARQATLELADSTFKNNSSTGNGGAISVAGATITATGTNEFTNNTAASHAGAIYVVYYNVSTDEGTSTLPGILKMTGGTFAGNTAVGGGAVSIRSDCEANFDGTTFTGNSVEGSTDGTVDGNAEGGGAIYVGWGELNLKDAIFADNTAEVFGGAVQVYYADVTATGGKFSGNTAKTGGALCSLGDSSDIKFSGTEFSSNTATAGYDTTKGGGAIAITKGSLALSGVTMDKNSGTFYGGTVYANNAIVTINGDSVISNSKDRTGGALHFRGGCTTTMEDVTLSGNTATGSGKGNGVIYTAGGTLDMINVTANDNYGDNGGVMYASGTKVTIKDSTWSGNTAILGGSIYNSGATITVENSTIKDGYAELGGAVYSAGGTLTTVGTTLSGNTAAANDSGKNGFGGAVYGLGGKVNITAASKLESNTAVKGGAILLDGAATGTVDKSTLNGNSAVNGGAIYLDKGAAITLTDSTIEGNSSTGDGGAIYITDTSEEKTAATALNISGTTFKNNTAAAKGGAISTGTGCPNIVISATGCTFENNSATGAGGGAIVIQNGNCKTTADPETAKIVFTNSTFTGNTAKTTGGAVELRSSVCAKFDGVTATGNVSKGTSNGGGVFYVTSNYSRLFLTGTITQSGNTAKKGNFAYLYNNGYSCPTRIYTTDSDTAAWYKDVYAMSGTGVTFGVTTMP